MMAVTTEQYRTAMGKTDTQAWEEYAKSDRNESLIDIRNRIRAADPTISAGVGGIADVGVSSVGTTAGAGGALARFRSKSGGAGITADVAGAGVGDVGTTAGGVGGAGTISGGSLSELLKTLTSQYEETRTGKQKRYEEGKGILQSIVEQFGPGYLKGEEKRMLADMEQGMVGRGLGGTTRPAAVGMGIKADIRDRATQARTGAMTNVAQFMAGFQDIYPDPGTLAHLATGGFSGLLQEKQVEAGERQAALEQHYRIISGTAGGGGGGATGGVTGGGAGDSGSGGWRPFEESLSLMPSRRSGLVLDTSPSPSGYENYISGGVGPSTPAGSGQQSITTPGPGVASKTVSFGPTNTGAGAATYGVNDTWWKGVQR